MAAVALILIGLLVQLAVTTTRAAEPYSLVVRQVLYALASVLVGYGAFVFGYRRAVAWSRPMLIVVWVLQIPS